MLMANSSKIDEDDVTVLIYLYASNITLIWNVYSISKTQKQNQSKLLYGIGTICQRTFYKVDFLFLFSEPTFPKTNRMQLYPISGVSCWLILPIVNCIAFRATTDFFGLSEVL